MNDRLDAATWPYIYVVIVPDPRTLAKKERGCYYPGTDEPLYDRHQAVALMRRLTARGLTCRAVSDRDDFDLPEWQALQTEESTP